MNFNEHAKKTLKRLNGGRRQVATMGTARNGVSRKAMNIFMDSYALSKAMYASHLYFHALSDT